ncbi:MAG: hypothetical protein KDJ28_07295 [Candidatus Competibacteraceae bacterium]|nr:hypothetical protein [Candidatus Competibacteraceae bacterium]
MKGSHSVSHPPRVLPPNQQPTVSVKIDPVHRAEAERAVLKRVFAALACASQTWRRRVINKSELKQIEELKAELHTKFRQQTARVSSPASSIHLSSNHKA